VNRGRLSQRLLMPIHRVPQLLAIPTDGEREGKEDRYAYRRDEPSDRACQQEELLDYAGTLPQGAVGITVALGPGAPTSGLFFFYYRGGPVDRSTRPSTSSTRLVTKATRETPRATNTQTGASCASSSPCPEKRTVSELTTARSRAMRAPT
jgi:hypothetical protein